MYYPSLESCHARQICGCRDFLSQKWFSYLLYPSVSPWIFAASLWTPTHTVSIHKILGQDLKVLHFNCASYENPPPLVTPTCKFHLMSPSSYSGRDSEQTAFPYSPPHHAWFYISVIFPLSCPLCSGKSPSFMSCSSRESHSVPSVITAILWTFTVQLDPAHWVWVNPLCIGIMTRSV